MRSSRGTGVVPTNRAFYVAAGLEHEVTMSGEVKIRTALIDERAIPNLPEETCVINVSPLLRELIVAAVQVPLDYASGSRGETLMRLLIEEIIVSNILPLHLPIPEDARIKMICQAIILNPANVSTADQWADRLNVTAKTVHRLFTKATGMTFSQWREQARLLFALRQIAAGERIIDIAFDCGYASQSAFTAMFRRHFGMPPSAF